jgi:hypothetical protein
MNDSSDVSQKPQAADRDPARSTPFGSNDVRLSPRGWIAAGLIVVGLFWALPRAWEQVETFQPGADYRIPFRLGEDYWMVDRYCRSVAAEEKILVVGDSVVWGHYVASDATLSHYLNEQSGGDRFANLGIDGIHPAALAGLVENYGGSLRGRKVLLFCNPLWMSSASHDLQGEKEFAFNHPRLVPQFDPWIPCYRESIEGRLGIVVQRNSPFLGWVRHLRAAYFDNEDFFTWTMEHPDENPARAVTLELPSPDEPPSPPPVAKPWKSQGIQPYGPAWVELESSFQWQSFQRTIAVLQSRGNRVFVLVGPFNEHMLKPKSLETYRRLKAGIESWLDREGIAHCVPQPLPSELYADASHPLAAGYEQLAQKLAEDAAFAEWAGGRR